MDSGKYGKIRDEFRRTRPLSPSGFIMPVTQVALDCGRVYTSTVCQQRPTRINGVVLGHRSKVKVTRSVICARLCVMSSRLMIVIELGRELARHAER